MLGINVDREREISARDVMNAERQRRMDAASVGFSVSQEEVPQDRGQLQQSGFPPEERNNGDIVYGYTAPYAEPMEEGTDGFYPPLAPILEWSERVSGDVGLGFYVAREKIPNEGIDAQPYLAPSADRVEAWLDSHGLEQYL